MRFTFDNVVIYHTTLLPNKGYFNFATFVT